MDELASLQPTGKARTIKHARMRIRRIYHDNTARVSNADDQRSVDEIIVRMRGVSLGHTWDSTDAPLAGGRDIRRHIRHLDVAVHLKGVQKAPSSRRFGFGRFRREQAPLVDSLEPLMGFVAPLNSKSCFARDEADVTPHNSCPACRVRSSY